MQSRQSTKENRTPKVEKLSGTQSTTTTTKKEKNKTKKEKKKLLKRSYTKC